MPSALGCAGRQRQSRGFLPPTPPPCPPPHTSEDRRPSSNAGGRAADAYAVKHPHTTLDSAVSPPEAWTDSTRPRSETVFAVGNSQPAMRRRCFPSRLDWLHLRTETPGRATAPARFAPRCGSGADRVTRPRGPGRAGSCSSSCEQLAWAERDLLSGGGLGVLPPRVVTPGVSRWPRTPANGCWRDNFRPPGRMLCADVLEPGFTAARLLGGGGFAVCVAVRRMYTVGRWQVFELNTRCVALASGGPGPEGVVCSEPTVTRSLAGQSRLRCRFRKEGTVQGDAACRQRVQ